MKSLLQLVARIWQRFLRDLGLQGASRRLFEIDEGLIRQLQDIAIHEQRSEEEVVSDLLNLALLQRQKDDENLKHWKALTPREQEVAALACIGYTNHEIASRLVISPDTVKTHVRNTLQKFGFRRKVELRQALSDWDFSPWDIPYLPPPKG